MNAIQGFIKTFVDPVASSLLDPLPVAFTRNHEEGVRPLCRALTSPSDQVSKLKQRLCRNSFLCGCLDFLEHEPVEYLVVGYGTKHGIGTFITGVEYILGNETSVSSTLTSRERVHKHILLSSKSEVVLVHNHPPNWLNVAFDNLPIASDADRASLVASKYLNPILAFRTLRSEGSLRFFLIENGFVREFRTPNVLASIQGLLKRLTLPAPGWK